MKKMVVQYEFRGTCHTCQAFMNFVVYDSIEYRFCSSPDKCEINLYILNYHFSNKYALNFRCNVLCYVLGRLLLSLCSHCLALKSYSNRYY